MDDTFVRTIIAGIGAIIGMVLTKLADLFLPRFLDTAMGADEREFDQAAQIREELRKDNDWLRSEVDRLRGELAEMRTNYAKARSDLEKLKIRTEKLEAENEELRERLCRLEENG